MGSSGSGGGAAFGIIMLVELAFAVLMIASMWRVFDKAGKPGWAAIIPIYNTIVFLEIAEKPLWWIVLFFIPVVQIVIYFIATIALAEKFGQGAGFGIGLALLPFIFYPILGFGEAEYEGGVAPQVPAPPYRPSNTP